MQAAHQIVRLQHPAHAVGQRECHRHGQSLGHGHHDERHGNHDRLQQVGEEGREMLTDGQQRVGIGGKINHYAPDDNQCGDDIARTRDETPQTVQLFVEWCLHAVVNLCRHVHLSVLCAVAHFRYAHDALSLHDLCSSHHTVGGEGCLAVLLFGQRTFMADRLARQCRLVYLQSFRF